jgi:hypothetical protein
MVSPTSSQELLLSKSASNKTPVHVHCSYNLTQQNLQRSKPDFTAKKYGSTKPETEAKIDVSCVNCDFEDKIDWRGYIVGKGIHGSVYAFFTRIKHKHKLLKGSKGLMGLLTICNDCCIELGFDGKPDEAHVLKSRVFSQISATLVLSLSYKEVEEVVSSRAIIMEGPLMSAIRTIGIDGRGGKWDLLNRPKPILENW